jgi:hypothetical protein
MKMLKFTNLNLDRLGDPVFINKDWIVSVYENHRQGGSLTTTIFGGPHNTEWYVEESLNEVIKIINEGK